MVKLYFSKVWGAKPAAILNDILDTRCDSCVADHMDLYKACLASENLVGSTGTIYYGTQMFECPCVVEYKLENGQGEPTYTVDGKKHNGS